MKGTDMPYILTGFTHHTGLRVFAFQEGIGHGSAATAFSVSADLALARKHGIPVQDLPLLCRAVLEQRSESDDRRAFMYTESDMSLHADAVRAEAESRKRKAPRRPFTQARPDSASLVQPA